MSDEPPRIEVTIAAPVDVVWAALRDKNTIRHWHGWEADGLDEEIDIIYFKHPTEDAVARTLGMEDGDQFRLEPVEGGTRVVLTRAPRGGNPEWDAYYEDITEGWTTFLQQLRFAVEVRPGQERRTIFLLGDNKDGIDLPATVLAADLLLGSPSVYYQAANQAGYVWDSGLLVVAGCGPTEAKPKGVAMVIVSTYGLPADELARLTDRWQAWWTEHVGPLQG